MLLYGPHHRKCNSGGGPLSAGGCKKKKRAGRTATRLTEGGWGQEVQIEGRPNTSRGTWELLDGGLGGE